MDNSIFYRFAGTIGTHKPTLSICAEDIIDSGYLLDRWFALARKDVPIYCLYSGVGEECFVFNVYKDKKSLDEGERNMVETYEIAPGTRQQMEMMDNNPPLTYLY